MRSAQVAITAPAALLIAMLSGCTCFDGPIGPFPGGRLREGTLVSEPDIDWSFTDGELVELQLVEPPRSRTAGILLHDSKAFVPCDLGFIGRRVPAPARWMLSTIHVFKHWHEDALIDGRVVLRIAGKRYERQAVREVDPEVLAALRTKMENQAEVFFSAPLAEAPPEGPNDVWFFRMDPR